MIDCKKLLIVLLSFFISISIKAQVPDTFSNPILSGFYPDPSICRVGDDYYLATSSFEWFPGIPIFHSKDLVNWEPIGHALTRPEQLKMVNNRSSSGVWAPSIRYHEGIFYVTATCKQCGNNFYVTATRPEGPYSDPIYLDTPKGIDPSFFFDDDGRCWFTANRHPEKPLWPIEHIVYIQELDLKSGKLIGEPIDLTSGIEHGVQATEAPHLYKVNGRYYLITAEGMTWNGHMVCMYESEHVTGPYLQVPGNPVLSHRDKPDSPIQHTGHADLVQTPAGDWWSVMLGVRKIDGNYYLGRESFLTPVEFKQDSVLFNPGHNRLLLRDTRPNLPWTPVPPVPDKDDFNSDTLKLYWNFLRTPLSKWHSLQDRPGWLSLQLRPEQLTEAVNPSLLARRFQHHQFQVSTRLDFNPTTENEVAGLVALQNDRFHYRLEQGLKDGKSVITLYKTFNKNRKVVNEIKIAEAEWSGAPVVFSMEVNNMTVRFFYGSSIDNLQLIGGEQSCDAFCSNYSGGFTGAYVGMYASSQGQESKNTAHFDFFHYKK